MRDIFKPFRVVFFVLMIIAVGGSCGGASSREKTIHITYDAANATADQLVQITQAGVDYITANAKSIEDGKAQLAAWHDKINHAKTTLGLLYKAISDAALLNTDQSLSALVQAALVFSTEIQSLKGDK